MLANQPPEYPSPVKSNGRSGIARRARLVAMRDAARLKLEHVKQCPKPEGRMVSATASRRDRCVLAVFDALCLTWLLDPVHDLSSGSNVPRTMETSHWLHHSVRIIIVGSKALTTNAKVTS